MKKLIKDRQGRVLEFSQKRIEELVYFKLEFHRACAAYVNCRINGEVLMLEDIFVEEKCVVRNPDLLSRLLGRKTLAVNFRKQGFGSQMLTTVVAYARSKGLKRIEGRLKEKDLVPNPNLPQWYKKRGFTIVDSQIYLNLVKATTDDSRYMPKN